MEITGIRLLAGILTAICLSIHIWDRQHRYSSKPLKLHPIAVLSFFTILIGFPILKIWYPFIFTQVLYIVHVIWLISAVIWTIQIVLRKQGLRIRKP